MFAPPVTKRKSANRQTPAPAHRRIQDRIAPLRQRPLPMGNQAMLRSLAPPPVISSNLAIGPVDHPLEHEAQRTAERIMHARGPEVAPGVAPKFHPAGVDPGEPAGPPAPGVVDQALNSPGRSLDPAARAFMEPRFGQDFSAVRIHCGGTAEDSAMAVGARAYTVGQDIVFGRGEYAPETSGGRSLLAHELAHVAQAGSGGAAATIRRSPDTATKHDAGPARVAVVRIPWTEEDWDFEERLANAVARKTRTPESVLPQYLNPPAASFHESVYRSHRYKSGQLVRVRVTFNYYPDAFHPLEDVTVTSGDPAPVASDPAPKQDQPKPAVPPASAPRPAASYPRRHVLDTVVLWELAEHRIEIDDFDTWTYVVFDETNGEWNATSHGPLAGTKPAPPPPPPKPLTDRQQTARFLKEEFGLQHPQDVAQRAHDAAAAGLRESNPFSLKNLPFTLAGVFLPGAVIRSVAEFDSLGNIVRIEWTVNEEAAEASDIATIKTPSTAPKELQVGDVIDTGDVAGRQKVVHVEKGMFRTEAFSEGYINKNPAATASEFKNGEILDAQAQAGKLPGVSRVEGVAESSVPGVRTGDYAFVGRDGSRTAADLWEPRTKNITAQKIIDAKQGQANVMVVGLGEGESGSFTAAQAEGVASDLFSTPNHDIDRIVFMKDDRVLLDRSK